MRTTRPIRAAWYEPQGAARDVLWVGEMPNPERAREVWGKLAASGIHAGDPGKRRGWWGSVVPVAGVVAHGGGAGATADPNGVVVRFVQWLNSPT